MSENYFDIERDIEIERNGGFFCHACVVGKPAEEQSPDPRYCYGCYELLLKEAELLPVSKRPGWIPKPHQTPQEHQGGDKKQYPIGFRIDEGKTKMSTLNSPSPEVDNLRPRGRPKTYKKRQLPDDKIKQLHKEGMGAKTIATQLRTEQGITVSYKTIQRVLAGQRA